MFRSSGWPGFRATNERLAAVGRHRNLAGLETMMLSGRRPLHTRCLKRARVVDCVALATGPPIGMVRELVLLSELHSSLAVSSLCREQQPPILSCVTKVGSPLGLHPLPLHSTIHASCSLLYYSSLDLAKGQFRPCRSRTLRATLDRSLQGRACGAANGQSSAGNPRGDPPAPWCAEAGHPEDRHQIRRDHGT